MINLQIFKVDALCRGSFKKKSPRPLSLIWLLVTLVSCAPTSQPSGMTTIYHDRNSEFGQKILSLDAKARTSQNVTIYRNAIRDFESNRQEGCKDVLFDALVEPGQQTGPNESRYKIKGKSVTCGIRTYSAIIQFSDSHRTVVKNVKILKVTP